MDDHLRNDLSYLRRLNTLLDEALTLPIEEREIWLGKLSAEHADLQPTLRSMLAHASLETCEFLSEPVHIESVAPESLTTGEAAGQIVGPYQLIRELGKGGMGTVWLAERADGALKRTVALKLPRFAWVPGLTQRLQRERDMLAALAHPHIARLYDAGVSSEGRPYLALEYVEGQAIDDYCREHALNIPARLRLVLQIAQALAHAHARLIVHRDIKPSNVLVTSDGQTHLLDFGVAKLLDTSLNTDEATGKSLTQLVGQALTPDYASPEQIRGEAITVASDVFSLGVLLYELLTSKRPFVRKYNSSAELQTAVAHDVAPLASHAADKRDAKTLRGDLDTILAKALKADPGERYSSVEAFAADISRYLAGEPVQAQPDSAWYRFKKFVQRNLLAVLAAITVALSLGAGSGVAIWQARIARAEAERAEQVKKFIASIFTQAVPRRGVGGVVTASDLLSAAAVRVEKELGNDPEVEAELAVIIGNSFDSLGEPKLANSMLRKLIPKTQAKLGVSHLSTVRAKLALVSSMESDNTSEALAVLNEVVPVALNNLPSMANEAVLALHMQSFVLAKFTQKEPSIAALKQAIEVGEKYLGIDHYAVIRVVGLLSNTYGLFEDRPHQLEYAAEAVRRAQRAFSNQRPHGTLIASERWYAEALRNNGRPADAIPILKRVVEDQEKLDSVVTYRVRNAKVQLALALQHSGDLTAALPLMREVVALEMQQNATEADDRRAYGDVLVELLQQVRRVDEGLVENDRVIAVSSRIGNDLPHRAISRKLRQARLLGMAADFSRAEALVIEATIQAKAAHSNLHATAQSIQAEAYVFQSKPKLALRVLDQLAVTQALDTLSLPLQSDINAIRGIAALDLGDISMAQPALMRCQELFLGAQIAASARVHDCLIGNARLALQQRKPQDAMSLLTPLVSSWEGVNAGSPWHGEALYWLSHAQAQSGKTVSASRNASLASTMLQSSGIPALRQLLAKSTEH
jgi:eukaryotic-like serine/threonine-protein kinase